MRSMQKDRGRGSVESLGEEEVFARVQQLATKHGMRWYNGSWPDFDYKRGHAADCADDLVHELAHWICAPKSRRMKPYFGLGHPGMVSPSYQEVSDAYGDEEECKASLLGIAMLYDCGGKWHSMLVEHGWTDMDEINACVVARLRTFVRSNVVSSDAVNAIQLFLRD